MFKLSAKSSFEGTLPKKIGSVVIKEHSTEYLTLMDCPSGKENDVCSALQRNHGIALPKVNKSTGRVGCCCLSFGAHYLLMGLKPSAELANAARLTDVWTVLPSYTLREMILKRFWQDLSQSICASLSLKVVIQHKHWFDICGLR